MRTRNKGLAHVPTVPRLPLNCAFPCASRFTPDVSWVDSPSVPGLHTRVPSTCVMGPGVPLNGAPLMTNCWILNEAAPVDRFTRALPLRTVQAKVPLWMFALIGLSTFWDVITPAKLCQRTVFDVWANAAEAPSNRHKLAITFFMRFQSFFVSILQLTPGQEVWPPTLKD